MYWDGESRGTGTVNYPEAVARSDLYIGETHWSSPQMIGQMHDFLVYDVALTTSVDGSSLS